jgi:hypothetical protein
MGGGGELEEGGVTGGLQVLQFGEESVGLGLKGGALVKEVTLQEETPLDLNVKRVLQLLLLTDHDIQS